MVAAAVNWRLEGVERPERLVQRGRQLAVGLAAAVRGEVLPEDGVVDVATEVEGERLLQADDGAEVALLAGRGELLEGVVERVDVGRCGAWSGAAP